MQYMPLTLTKYGLQHCSLLSACGAESAATALVDVAINSAQADKYLKFHAIMGCQAAESMQFTLANSKGHGAIQVPHEVWYTPGWDR